MIWVDYVYLDIYHVTSRDVFKLILSRQAIDTRDFCDTGGHGSIWDSDYMVARARRRLPSGAADCTPPLPESPRLSDFVPFHATPRPPALFNLVTDYARGIGLKNRDIVLLATTTRRLVANGVTVVVADRHPLSRQALFERGPHGVRMLDWVTLRSGNFAGREPRKSFKTPIPSNFANERGFVPPRKTRAGAEILTLVSVPLAAVSAVVCSADSSELKDMIRTATRRPRVPVKARRRAFFRAGD